MKEGTINANGTTVHYIQEGEGPDIVWVPAGDQACDVYAEQFAAFRDRFRCTSFDPRGAGKTVTPDPQPWQIADFAADCAELIRQVCDPPVVLTGLSLGALITQEVALSHHELLRVAIPMGTIARKTGFALEWEKAEIDMAAKGITMPADFSVIHYAVLSYPAEVLGDDDLWQTCRPNVASAYGDRDPSLLAAQWQACMEYDSLDRLPGCQVPMHVISFDQDLQTPPSRGWVVAEAAANGHFHLLEGMGHFSVFGHKPEAVTRCIDDILSGYDLVGRK
ncbi:MAG: alpha/beta fold hydrolase [Hyphomicrobiaceae bacterium]